MDDTTLLTDQPLEPVCPWCSAALAAEAADCPSCGANLTSDTDEEVPGLTAVDKVPATAAKPARSRGRLLSWISGEYPDATPTEADVQALARPDVDVQREILRLELEAEVARLQAESDAIMADAMVEGRVVGLSEGEAGTAAPTEEEAETAAPTEAETTPPTEDETSA